jgi:hypothetical protein
MHTYIIDLSTGIGIYISFLLLGLCAPIAKIVIEILKGR